MSQQDKQPSQTKSPMKETKENVILHHLNSQRAFFASNETKDVAFRLKQLSKLKHVVIEYQEQIQHALWDDLHKSQKSLSN